MGVRRGNDLARETDETLGLYGLERGQSERFGWQYPAARRRVERGVRPVELSDRPLGAQQPMSAGRGLRTTRVEVGVAVTPRFPQRPVRARP